MAKPNKGTDRGAKTAAAHKQLNEGRSGKGVPLSSKDKTARLTNSQKAVRETNNAVKNAKKK